MCTYILENQKVSSGVLLCLNRIFSKKLESHWCFFTEGGCNEGGKQGNSEIWGERV